jgi:hypothetical protein
LGDAACLGPLGGWAMSCVLGQVAAAVVGCCLWCVVGCGAGCGVLAVGVWVGAAIIVVGWGSVTWGLGGVSGSMVGMREQQTLWVSPVVGSPLVVSCMPHIPQIRGKRWWWWWCVV